MDTSDTLLWSGKVFDDEDEARLHTGIQAGGCGASGKQRSAPHAGRDGAGDLPFNAAQLADRCARRYHSIEGWLEGFCDQFVPDGVSSRSGGGDRAAAP
jgi:hypothetical protein